jgi:hypothetical protein
VFGRGGNTGKFQASVVEPMAKHLGLDYHRSFLTPPRSDEQRALDGYRIGATLLSHYAAPEWWSICEIDAPSARDQKRLASAARKALLSERGRGAVSLVAAGYSEYWGIKLRDTASHAPADDPRDYLGFAKGADDFSALLARRWPVYATAEKLEALGASEERIPVSDNPAVTDYEDYGWSVHSHAVAVLYLLPDDAPAREWILAKVRRFDLAFLVALRTTWQAEGERLLNLLVPEPVAMAQTYQQPH